MAQLKRREWPTFLCVDVIAVQEISFDKTL